jgi:hypothetical protein
VAQSNQEVMGPMRRKEYQEALADITFILEAFQKESTQQLKSIPC